jgi:hypothetical protein
MTLSLENSDLKNSIIVVSGLPRSGTSMMMKMLQAGGVEAMTDAIREADENNPNGYFEFERVKKMKEGDFDWLGDALGKSVKVIAALVTQLPVQYHYKVIFMQRDIQEVLASQKKMLGRLGKPDDQISDATLAKIYQEHLKTVEAWLAKQKNMQVLYVNYNQMVADPASQVQQLNQFLGGHLNIQAMSGAINQDLYRERKK